MTEPAAYLDKARQMLKEAYAVADIDLPEAAGRAAPRIDRSLSTFLARSYKLKSVADYDVGGDSIVTATEAAAAIDTAGCFIDCIAGLI